MRRWILVLLLLSLVAAPTFAQPPLEEARQLFVRYHEDLSRLDRARDLLEKTLKEDSRVEIMLLLAQVYFAWGDVRAGDGDEKLRGYERGRELAKRAVELAPRNPLTHLWYAIHTGRVGQTRGVLRSLFLVPTIKEEIEIIFSLDPNLPGAHDLAGSVALELPRFLGGDWDEAEKHFRQGLKIDPRFTALRVDLARVLIKKGKHAEARKELQRVLSEKAPRSPADWAAKDSKRAREILQSIRTNS